MKKPAGKNEANTSSPPPPPQESGHEELFVKAKALVLAAYPPDPELVADCQALHDPYGSLDKDLSAYLSARDTRAAARVCQRRELAALAKLKARGPYRKPRRMLGKKFGEERAST